MVRVPTSAALHRRRSVGRAYALNHKIRGEDFWPRCDALCGMQVQSRRKGAKLFYEEKKVIRYQGFRGRAHEIMGFKRFPLPPSP